MSKKLRFQSYIIIFFAVVFTVSFSASTLANQYSDAAAACNRHDCPAAIKILEPLADRGYVHAQTWLASIYENGKEGVKQDYDAAFKWYLVASDVSADAQFRVGLFYENGWSVTRDKSEAFAWYLKAANKGNASAEQALGVKYEFGEDASTQSFSIEANPPPSGADFVEAAKWYRKAADQWLGLARFRLAWMYMRGRGVQQNVQESYLQYRLSGQKDENLERGFNFSPTEKDAAEKIVQEYLHTHSPAPPSFDPVSDDTVIPKH